MLDFILISFISVTSAYLLQKFKKKTSPYQALAQELSLILQNSNPSLTNQSFTSCGFFSELAEAFIEQSRQFGTAFRAQLQNLRNQVIQEERFATRKRSYENGSLAQLTLCYVMVWILVLVSTQVLKTSYSLHILLFIQVLGPCFLRLSQRWLYKKSFKKFNPCFRCLYLFKGHLEAGVPLRQAIQRSSIHSLIDHSSLWPWLNEGVREALQRIREQGPQAREQINFLIEEVWFQRDLAWSRYSKQGEILTLLSLPLFGLIPYFIFLFEMMNDILA